MHLMDSISQESFSCKQLRGIAEAFEFKGIAAGIGKEHGRLFTVFSLEADIGLNQEIRPGRFQLFSQFVPIIPFEDNAEMTGRDLMTVDGVCRRNIASVFDLMGDNLMAEKIKIDPAGVFASQSATEAVDVKVSRLVQITNRKSQMEWGKGLAH